MPTGSGKSLCFQLPAVLHTGKVAVVFSPLIALMKDQVEHLQHMKIQACSLNSKMTGKEREAVISDLRSVRPDTVLLYIAPEQVSARLHITKYFGYRKILVTQQTIFPELKFLVH